MVEVFAFGLVVVTGLFWLAYRRPRPRRWLLPRRVATSPVSSPVDRQHRHLQAGGLIGDGTVAATQTRLRALLAAGRAAEVECELRPGLDFAVRVRALAEIGTPEATSIIRRLLGRRLSRDPVEQGWYWVDVAAALRKVNCADALPALLQYADTAADTQQGAALAAEVVAFPAFRNLMHDPSVGSARPALRALVRAARGCRDGVLDTAFLVRAGLGDSLASVAESARRVPDPWVTAAVLEAERVARRLGHWARLLSPGVGSAVAGQKARLAASRHHRMEWLCGAADHLLTRFPVAPVDEQAAILHCLGELRADVVQLFPILPDRRRPWWAAAVRCLTWSKSAVAGPVLAGHAARWLGTWRSWPAAVVLLGTLRGHRCAEAESVLVGAAGSSRREVRVAAVGSLGWWDPYDGGLVLNVLRDARSDPDHGVRQSAVAALARVGERTAVEQFIEGLHAEEPAIQQLTATAAAEEGLTWLWPDLEAMADGPDAETALVACEALERLREHVLGPLG
jgi:HEAT repeat protein